MKGEKIRFILWSVITVLIVIIFSQLAEIALRRSGYNPNVDIHNFIDTAMDKYEEYQIKLEEGQKYKEKTNKRRKHRARARNYYNYEIKSDSQNVHNSQVVHDLKEKYERLCELVPDVIPHELTDFFTENEWKNCVYDLTYQEILGRLETQEGVETLDKIRNSNAVITSLNTSEMDVLSKVWRRTNDVEDNTMVENLLLLLTEIGQEGSVCTQGRVARMMSIFIHLDSDPVLSAPIIDSQTYMKESYDKTYNILQDMIKSEGMKRLYNKLMLTEEEQIHFDNFKTRVKEVAVENLKKDYEDIVSKNIMTNIIKNCEYGLSEIL